MRLLPKDADFGWTPYAWLIYVFMLLPSPLVQHSVLDWVATIAGLIIFLPLYFLGFWIKGKRLLIIVGVITCIGLIVCPINPGGSVYFVYAASFLPWTGEAGFAIRCLLALLAIIGLEAWALHLSIFVWGSGIVFSALVASANLHYAQRARDNQKLRRAQEEVEHLAKIAERERIARDLHDVLGHTLSLIVIKSELAARLAEKDVARAVQEIKDVERISRDALAQVRSTVRGYHASSLKEEVQQATAALEAAGVAVHCDFPAAALPAAQERVLALALREGVTNVIRHAKAHSCELHLRQMDGACELEIKDDGCGQLSPEGLGLSGMRERVQAVGGSLHRDVFAGTRLVVSLPLNSK